MYLSNIGGLFSMETPERVEAKMPETAILAGCL
jgi:hypothetical protein